MNGHPLGWANVTLGVALAAAWPVNALASAGAGYSLRTVLLTSMASALLCLWLNRRLIKRVIPRTPYPAAGSELS